MSDKTLDERFLNLSPKAKSLIKKLKEKQALEDKEKLLLDKLLEEFPIETYKLALEEGYDLLSDDAKDEIIENLKPEDPEIFLEDLEIKINGLSLYCARCGYELKLEGTGRIPTPGDCPKECPNCERDTIWCRNPEEPIDFWEEMKRREWKKILKIIEKGDIEYQETLVFRNEDDHLLIGYDGNNFLVRFRGEKISLPSDIINHIKNSERRILLQILKEREESKEKSKTDLLISLAEEQCNFFADEHGDGYASLQIGDSWKVMKIRSKDFKEYLHLLLYQKGKKAPSSEVINVAINLLEGKAKFENRRIELSTRVASKDGAIFYDLGWDDWRIIKITKDGWELIPHGEPIFKRYSHQLPQVEPAQVDVDEYKLLSKYVPLNQDDEMIFLVHVASSLIPTFPHPIIMPYGPHGSGKTMLFRLIRMLIDPSSVAILSFPKEGREFIQMLAHHYLALFDNVSRITEWQSDALCRAVTGEGQSKRELYTDDDDIIYSFRRCIGLNGINLTADRPDLLDRCIPYQLRRIPKTERKQEEKILKEFREDLPKIFGGLLSTISKALEIYPDVEKELAGKPLPRMADFMIWGEAIARALGYQPFEFYDKYWEKIQSINREAVESHVVGDLILKLVEKEMENKKEKEKTIDGKILVWEGTPTDLFAEIEWLAEEFKINIKGEGFPKAPHTLMRKLNEIETNLQDESILLEKLRESNKRIVRIYKREEEDKVGEKSVISVIASSIRRKSNDAFNDALAEGSKASQKASYNFTGENDACDGNDAFFPTFSLPPHIADSLSRVFFVLATKHRHEFTIEELAQETGLSEDEVRKHLYNLPIIKPHENTFAINPEGKVTVLMKEDIGPVVDPNNPSRVINATKNDVLTVPIQIALNGLRQGKMEIIKKIETRNEGLNSSQNLSPEFVLQDQKGRSDDSEAKGKEC